MRLSEKLGALCAAAAILPLGIASVIVSFEVSSYSRGQSVERLHRDARAAASIYEKRLEQLRVTAQRLAVEIASKAVVGSEAAGRDSGAAWARLQDMLPQAQKEANLDFLIVTDATGRVIARHNDRPLPGETLLAAEDKNPIAEKVIAEGSQLRNSPAASVVIEREDRLARMNLNQLAGVRRAGDTIVKEALMIEAGAPIFSGGRFLGMALIGQMLNNYFTARPGAASIQTPLIAEIQRTLYRASNESAGVMIALGNTVIASSVTADGAGSEPAFIGVESDSIKPDEIDVLRDGARARAVAWQPLVSIDGSQLGAIGVAVTFDSINGPVAAVRNTLIVIGVLSSLLAGAAGFLFGRALANRLTALAEAASRMRLGELSTNITDRPTLAARPLPSFLTRDEISRLAEQLDAMRESFKQAIERLRRR